MAKDSTTDDYYPFRWKVADAVEDIFVLHRTKAIGVLALLGLALIIFGFTVLGWGGGDSPTNTAGPSTPTSSSAVPASVADDSSSTSAVVRSSTTTAPTTTTSTASIATTTTTTSTTSTLHASSRGAASAEELANAEAGAIAEMSPPPVRIGGGVATDDTADEIVDTVSSIYSDLEVVDLLVVDPSFAATEAITFRLSAPDLFRYNRPDLNPTYFPLIDQLAAAAVEAGSWRIEVSGHTDDSGPADGNQLLSEGRALSAAQRLISQGVSAGQVTSVGRGEEQPVASNDTEAGRLANRRVEFLVTR